MYSVKQTKDGAVTWLTFGNKYQFTKSKCQFLIDSVVKQGFYSLEELKIVKA